MRTDPKSKEDLMNRLLSRDFDGDFTALGEAEAQLVRVSHNKALLIFPITHQTYEITVRKPRPATQKKALRETASRPRYRSMAAH